MEPAVKTVDGTVRGLVSDGVASFTGTSYSAGSARVIPGGQRRARHPRRGGARGRGLLIQRLGHGPGRVHLDIHTDDLAAQIAGREELGAERVQLLCSWWILRDAAGLLFCVVPGPAGSLNDSNAQR